jgi:hypothetical protein
MDSSEMPRSPSQRDAECAGMSVSCMKIAKLDSNKAKKLENTAPTDY